MPDTSVKLQDITPVKSTFDNDDQLLLINPTGEARISKEDFLDAMPDDAITLIGDITTTGIEGDTVAKQLGALENSKAAAITDTATGVIANFPDGADDIPVADLVVNIEPKQSGSGDPSPSNVRTISGWTGCNVTRTGINVWDEEWENGYYSRVTGEKAGNSDTKYFRSKNYIPCVPNTSYYFKAPSVHASNNTYYAVLFYGADKSYISAINSGIGNTARTTPQNAQFMTLYIEVGTSGATYQHDISINYPSTDTAYHSGTANETISASWQTEAGTVYGGTIDVATGLLTVDKGIVTLDGTENWSGSGGEYYTSKHDMLRTNDYVSLITCDKLTTVTRASVSSTDYHITGYSGSSYQGQNWIYARINSAVTTGAECKAWFTANPTTVVYPLATPQTYQLTGQQLATFLGVNNVWADTGNVSVTYPADTKMFIEKLTMPTEDDLVANQAITSGKYFMIGNSLYLALANIASGAQITIGTNAQRVSLADALNAINS